MSICPCSFSNFYDRAEISWAQRWSMSRWKRSGKGTAQDSKCSEVRWGCTLLGVGERCEVREAKLFLSFSGRAFLRGNISTRQEHTGPFTISRIGTCARLHFGRLAPHRARNMISHRSRLWIILKNEIIKKLLVLRFPLAFLYNKTNNISSQYVILNNIINNQKKQNYKAIL